MNDKQFEDCKGRVKALLEEWAFGTKDQQPRMMSLNHFIIKVHYRRDSFETPDGDIAGAHVNSLWYYKTGEIEFNCQELYALGDLELELLVIHELCHILVNEMREYGNGEESDGFMHHEEHVVTNLALAFLQTKYWGRQSIDEATKSGEVGE